MPAKDHTSAATRDAVNFHRTHFRKSVGVAGTTTCGGFGPDGSITLMLASPTDGDRMVIENGQPVMRRVESCMNDPEMQALRDEVLGSLVPLGPGRLRVSTAFVRYAIKLIRLTYEVSDEDLTFLLTGSAWQDSICRHLLGGDGMVKMLARLDTSSLRPTPAPQAPPVAPPPTPAPAPVPAPPRGFLRRLLRR